MVAGKDTDGYRQQTPGAGRSLLAEAAGSGGGFERRLKPPFGSPSPMGRGSSHAPNRVRVGVWFKPRPKPTGLGLGCGSCHVAPNRVRVGLV